MEKQIKLRAHDGKTIYGVLNSSKKSDRLIIFVHGLSGHVNEHKFYNAVSFFTKKGFDTFRISLYEGEKNARILTDTTLSIHGKDIVRVTNYFKKKYKNVYAIGHSYGGPSILLAEPNEFNAIVLWDPTYDVAFMSHSKDTARFDKSLGNWIVNWGVEIIVGKRMVDEAEKLDMPKYWWQVKVPLKIILAGAGMLKKQKKDYERWTDEVVVIKKADHNFNPEGTEKELFDETYKWLKKY